MIIEQQLWIKSGKIVHERTHQKMLEEFKHTTELRDINKMSTTFSNSGESASYSLFDTTFQY